MFPELAIGMFYEVTMLIHAEQLQLAGTVSSVLHHTLGPLQGEHSQDPQAAQGLLSSIVSLNDLLLFFRNVLHVGSKWAWNEFDNEGFILKTIRKIFWHLLTTNQLSRTINQLYPENYEHLTVNHSEPPEALNLYQSGPAATW